MASSFVDRFYSQVQLIGGAKFVGDMFRVADATQRFGAAAQGSGAAATAATNKIADSWDQLYRSAYTLGQTIKLVGIFEGFKFIKNMAVDAAQIEVRWESIRATMNALYGDAKKGGEAFNWIKQFSLITPFTIEQVADAVKTFEGFNITPTKQMLSDVAALAKMSGRPYRESVMATMQAMMNNIRRMSYFKFDRQTMDVLARLEGKASYKAATPMQRLDIVFKELHKRYGGMMDEMAKTTEVKLQNMHQAWQEFEVDFIGTGGFKGVAVDFAAWFIQWMDKIAVYIKAAANIMMAGISSVLKFITHGIPIIGKFFAGAYDRFSANAMSWIDRLRVLTGRKPLGELPKIPHRGTDTEDMEGGAGGGASSLARQIIFGGKFAGIGVNPTQLPGMARTTPKTFRVIIQDAKGRSLDDQVQEAVNKALWELVRTGHFVPTGA